MKKIIVIILIGILFSCRTDKCDYVVVNENPYIAYCKNGTNINYKNSNFDYSDKVEKLHLEALQFRKKGDDFNAKKKMLSALKIEPTNPILLNDMGNIAEQNKNFDKAIDYFQKAIISADSSYFPAEYNLAYLYAKIGEQENAEYYFYRIINSYKIDFLSGLSYRGLAEMYIDYGFKESAKKMITKAKNLMEKYPEFLNNFRELEKRIDQY